jgi:hypothetical protein
MFVVVRFDQGPGPVEDLTHHLDGLGRKRGLMNDAVDVRHEFPPNVGGNSIQTAGGAAFDPFPAQPILVRSQLLDGGAGVDDELPSI